MKIEYRRNPTDRWGAVATMECEGNMFNLYSEIDDQGVRCTKSMLYLRQCWLGGIEPDNVKVEAMEKEEASFFKGDVILIPIDADFEENIKLSDAEKLARFPKLRRTLPITKRKIRR